MSDVIDQKNAPKKEELIAQLKKVPIVQLACERAGIGRATYYRWHRDDNAFAEAADEAIATGSSIINDLAESKLIAAIKEQNFSAIAFWLKHHHPTYATRVELAIGQKQNDELTPEQQAVVQKALALAALSDDPNNYEQKQ